MTEVPDLDLAELSVWLADFNAVPLLLISFRATIGSIAQRELPLDITIGDLIERDNIVVVVELVDGWEVSYLLVLDLPVRL